MILTHGGNSIKRSKIIEFKLFDNAPKYTLENNGSFSNVDFNGSTISKLTNGTIILYFNSSGSRIYTKSFILEFERVCYSPSGSEYANQITLGASPGAQLIRGFYTYDTNVGNKNQIVVDRGAGYSVFNDAYKVNANMSEDPFVVENSTFYDTLYKIKIIGKESKFSIYINDVKKAERDAAISYITNIKIRNETDNFPIGVRNFKLEYI